MNMFSVYNKSSLNMSDVKESSIDLIMTSPPYNLGTEYLDFKDKQTHTDYLSMMKGVLSECKRVLNPNGKLVIEAADTVFIDGVYIQLASLIQDICKNLGLYLENRHINFASSTDGIEVPDHGWGKNFTTKDDTHSNSQQILVFSKIKNRKFADGKIFYFNYKETDGHPCPFSKEECDGLLDLYFKKGQAVLDPFMGTATLGVEVLRRGGSFYGYEIVKEFYEKALNKLEKER